jgi:hypothetical protein
VLQAANVAVKAGQAGDLAKQLQIIVLMFVFASLLPYIYALVAHDGKVLE